MVALLSTLMRQRRELLQLKRELREARSSATAAQVPVDAPPAGSDG